jgi:hypothetical protein
MKFICRPTWLGQAFEGFLWFRTKEEVKEAGLTLDGG